MVEGGPVRFVAGDASAALGAGGFVTLSPGTAHHVRNEGEGPATLFTLCAPAGFDRFQIEAGRPLGDPHRPAPATDEDRQRVAAAAPRFGIDMHPDPALFQRPPRASIVPAGAGASVVRGEVGYTVLAAGGDTGGRYALALVSAPPGAVGEERRWDADAGVPRLGRAGVGRFPGVTAPGSYRPARRPSMARTAAICGPALVG